MSEELLPCPMSGKKACLIKEGYNYKHKTLYHVICHKSGIRTKNYTDPKEAIKTWNTRASQEPVDVSRDMTELIEMLEIYAETGLETLYNNSLDFVKRVRRIAEQGYLLQPQDNTEALEALEWIENDLTFGDVITLTNEGRIKTIRKALGGE